MAEKRARRDHLFKLNVAKFGLQKAKMIAVCVRKRRQGKFRETDRSLARWSKYRADRLWFLRSFDTDQNYTNDSN